MQVGISRISINWRYDVKKLTAVLALCSVPVVAHAVPPGNLSTAARRVIAARIIDPGSLVLRNTHLATATSETGQRVSLLCGEYNAKNRFGGYVGFKNFVYEPSVLKGVLSFEDDLRFDFFSVDGSGDASHDPADDVKAGIDFDKISERREKTFNFAIKYLPVCLGAT
jgi:hypothetical protein